MRNQIQLCEGKTNHQMESRAYYVFQKKKVEQINSRKSSIDESETKSHELYSLIDDQIKSYIVNMKQMNQELIY